MPAEFDRYPPLPQRWPVSVAGGQNIEEPISDFLARNPRTFASITATITGSISASDALAVTIKLAALPSGSIAFNVVAAGGDTTTTLAQKFAKAVSDNAYMQAFGCYATSTANVVTINWPGPLGNQIGVSAAVSIGSEVISLGGTMTATITGAIAKNDKVHLTLKHPSLTGGSSDYVVTADTTDTTTTLATSLAALVAADTALQALGVTCVSASNVVSVYWPRPLGDLASIVFTTELAVNGVATLGGTCSASDVVTITVNNAGLTGGKEDVAYTVLVGDSTLSKLATSVAAALNADNVLKALGFSAKSSSAQVLMSMPVAAGATTFGQAVTGATPTETVTLSLAPGAETAAISTSGTSTNGSGPIIPYNRFNFGSNGQIFEFQPGRPVLIADGVVAEMAQVGSPIS